MRDLLDAEEYLVPQPNLFPRTQGDRVQTNGPSRHQSYRVRFYFVLMSFFVLFAAINTFLFKILADMMLLLLFSASVEPFL